MPKHSLQQRIERILVDAAEDPLLDIQARWAKVVADGVADDAVKALGDIPQPTLDDIPLENAISYSARDADATLRLYPLLLEKVASNGLLEALDLDLKVTPMIAQMAKNGILVDRGHLTILDEVFADNLLDLESRIYKEVGRRFLVTSGDQVAEVLYEDLGLGGRRRTRSGKRLSTDEKSLQALVGRHQVVSLILEHREISKLQNTYVHKLPGLISPDGRIRMELGMSTVPSGRLNCWGGVNLLAIPVRTELGREIRRCFIAPPGCKLGSIDLNQIELRALAILSGDENMLEAFATDKDLHRLTASSLFHVPFDSVTFEQRQRGKTINFAIANQITAPGLLDQYTISGIVGLDVDDAQRDLDAWFKLYSRVSPWFETVYEEGRRNGFIRDSLSGRILWTPGLRSPIEKVESESKRIATNFKIQTFAQVVLKLGMAALWQWIKPGKDFDCIRPLLQIHDELLFECAEEDNMMDNWDDLGDVLIEVVVDAVPELSIPIRANCKWADSWTDLK